MVLTGFPWPSGPGASSWRKDRTSCCRHGSGPRGRAPGARFLRGEEDAVTAQRVAGTPSLQVSTGPSGGEVPRAAAPASFPGRVPSQEVHPHPDPRVGVRVNLLGRHPPGERSRGRSARDLSTAGSGGHLEAGGPCHSLGCNCVLFSPQEARPRGPSPRA